MHCTKCTLKTNLLRNSTMHMKNILLLLLFPALLSAQSNSQQVASYLGNIRFNQVAPPPGPVQFVFSSTTLQGKGDGKQTYKAVLSGAPYFADAANYGSLRAVFVTEGGKLLKVEPYKPATDAGGTLVRADVEGPKTWAMPDSTTLAEKMHHGEDIVERCKKQFWQAAGPVWRLVMSVFMALLPLLIMLGGVLRYLAKTSASESAMNMWGRTVFGSFAMRMHQTTASALLVVHWVVAIVVLIDVFLYLVWAGLDLWIVCGIWFACLFFVERITNFIVPNVRFVEFQAGQTPAAGPAIRARN